MYQKAIAYEKLPDGELAAAVMAELKHHYEQDEIVKGQYWENGKGCAVGCLLKSPYHIEYTERVTTSTRNFGCRYLSHPQFWMPLPKPPKAALDKESEYD